MHVKVALISRHDVMKRDVRLLKMYDVTGETSYGRSHAICALQQCSGICYAYGITEWERSYMQA